MTKENLTSGKYYVQILTTSFLHHIIFRFAPSWQCKWKEQDPNEVATSTTNATTCALLIREFYTLRQDLELQLETKTGQVATSKRFTSDRTFHPEIFLDYCGYNRKGDIKYAGMTGLPETFDMKELYGF